jgi:hypothetical protein
MRGELARRCTRLLAALGVFELLGNRPERMMNRGTVRAHSQVRVAPEGNRR